MRIVRADYHTLDGAAGGVVAGLFLAVASGIVFEGLRLGDAWQPMNLVGAFFDQSWARLEGFDEEASLVGLWLHLGVSAAIGVVTAWIASRTFLWATLTGGMVAALFWTAAQFGWLPLLNPAMVRILPEPLFAAGHLAFGFVVGAYLDVRGRRAVVWKAVPARKTKVAKVAPMQRRTRWAA